MYCLLAFPVDDHVNSVFRLGEKCGCCREWRSAVIRKDVFAARTSPRSLRPGVPRRRPC